MPLLLVAWIASHPVTARCAPGHDLRTGIRHDGRFECWPTPRAPRGWSVARFGPVTDWDGTFGRPDRSVQPASVRQGRIWCAGGSVPVVVDERSVACRAVATGR